MTRTEARGLWATSGLTYVDLTPTAMQSLRNCINAAMATSGLIDGTYRCHQRVTSMRMSDGSPRWVEIRCRSRYFTGRQAVTFEENGFVGFAGWADDSNIQPVLAGFARWLETMQRLGDQNRNMEGTGNA